MGILPKLSKLVEFELDDGSTAFVEVEEDLGIAGGRSSRGTEPLVERSQQSFRSAIRSINPIASSIISEIRRLEDPPDGVSVEFGVRMNAYAGLVIAPADSVSHFKVTLTWDKNRSR